MNDNVIFRLISWYKRPNKPWLLDMLASLILIIPVVFLIKTFVFGLYVVPTCCMETTMLVGERFFADKITPCFYAPKRGEIISFNNPHYKYSSNALVNLYQQYVSWNVINYTKRVIAIPGDHIAGKVEDGKPVVYINSQKLDEPYLNKYPIMARYKNGEINYRSYDSDKSLQEQSFYSFKAAEIAQAKLYYGEHFVLHSGVPALGDNAQIKDVYDVCLHDNEYWMMGDNRQGSWDSRSWGPLNIAKAKFHGRIIFRISSIDTDESWWILDLMKHPIDFWTRVRWSRFFQVLH